MTHSQADGIVGVPDERLVQLWHSDLLAGTIALTLGVPVRELQEEWSRLKYEGKIPRVQRHRTVVERQMPTPYEGNLDGRPTTEALPTAKVWSEDALLDALWKAHPEGPRHDYYRGYTPRP